ncbi:MAG: response regulator transcription factor [Allorhizobium sp.]
MSVRIVVLADSLPLQAALKVSLEHEGFEVAQTLDVQALRARLMSVVPDLLIISWSIPAVHGVNVCQEVRSHPATAGLPTIVLVPEDDPELRLACLSAGADDAIVKPVSPAEVAFRVKNLIRRLKPSLLEHVLKVGDLMLDRESRKVHRRNREVKLGPKEFKILEFLMRSPGRVWSRSEIKASLWGQESDIHDQAVDVHIGRLRKRISVGNGDQAIRTVRGAGYALENL